ncbi:hypothetical protein NDU88_004300 [Pleurodeles waltl]|uniref:Uncharacterized protein n=1 Tax=Pleurodeles waltl TaxID=8319 RepID=A0AAV7V4W7_PLEWA|nr:hypothetical protein NDU88_004300 [Pleurodeles waltl]
MCGLFLGRAKTDEHLVDVPGNARASSKRWRGMHAARSLVVQRLSDSSLCAVRARSCYWQKTTPDLLPCTVGLARRSSNAKATEVSKKLDNRLECPGVTGLDEAFELKSLY